MKQVDTNVSKHLSILSGNVGTTVSDIVES